MTAPSLADAALAAAEATAVAADALEAEDCDHQVKLAGLIEVVRSPNNVTRVFIDGVEFGYFISAAEPVAVDVDRDRPPGVRFTVLAERVHIRDELLAPA